MKRAKLSVLEGLRERVADSVAFFSNRRKVDREQSVCRAFLRSIGMPFSEGDIEASGPEPVDVSFKQARFQIKDWLDPGRRRGDEWKEKNARYAAALSLDDLLEDRVELTPMTAEELVPGIVAELEAKARRYGLVQCRNLDALVYVNLRARFLDPSFRAENLAALKAQGWRSVSFVLPPYGVVLFASEHAPAFLRDREGKLLREWPEPDRLFDP